MTICYKRVHVYFGVNIFPIMQNLIMDNNYSQCDKNSIKRMIKEHDFYEWKSTCLLYASLNTYIDSVNTIRMHTWWIVNQKLPHIYKSISAVMAVLMCGHLQNYKETFFENSARYVVIELKIMLYMLYWVATHWPRCVTLNCVHYMTACQTQC